jgi:hypothetical protein
MTQSLKSNIESSATEFALHQEKCVFAEPPGMANRRKYAQIIHRNPDWLI